LKSITVENARQIKGGPQQHLAVGKTPYLVDTHGGVSLLVFFSQPFLSVIHRCPSFLILNSSSLAQDWIILGQ
jgi:hypothetical protein